MRAQVRRVLAAVLLGTLLAGCATFPDDGPRDWQPKFEGTGELGRPPTVPDSAEPGPPGRPGESQPGAPQQPKGCVDPDPQVVATCLAPISAIAVLPDGVSALVAERTTGRVLRVQRGTMPELVATVAVDPAGDGGLTGLVLSPAYSEDQLVYAYATTAKDNQVLRIARGEPPKPVLTGIPRGPTRNGGALGVDRSGALLVATGDAGGNPDPSSLAGKLLRLDTLGHPAAGNPDPASVIHSSGLHSPGGVCTDELGLASWVTDRTGTRDELHKIVPGPLPAPAWTWPERPGVAGCTAQPGLIAIAQTGAASLFVLRFTLDGQFTGKPETVLAGTYGRLAAAAPAPDRLLWLGTVNKTGGAPKSSDDRVIRILPPAGGGGGSAA